MFAFNSIVAESVGRSPFELIYGEQVRLPDLAQDGNPVIKSIDQDPNLLSAMGNGSSKPGGACVLSLAH